MGREKNKKKKRNISIFHIILALVSVYVLVIFIKQEFIIRDLTKEEKTADMKLENLEQDIKNLEKKIDKSESVEYIEKIAREELDMVKPNEIIYKDKDKQGKNTDTVDWQI